MRLLGFIRMIIAVVRRVQLTSCDSHRRLFTELAPLLISAQDRGLPFGAERLLAPYRELIKRYIAALAKDREAQPGSSGLFRSLPLGCRFGKLHFSPLLQLAKLANTKNVALVNFASVPKTKGEIRNHLLGRIGLGGYAGEPARFQTVLGFSLAAYVNYLTGTRRKDPVLFAMLMASEFRYARDWIKADRKKDHKWIEHAATFAELERLVEIVLFTKTNPLRLSALRAALRTLAKGSGSRQFKANLLRHPKLLPYLEQLSFSVEGLRALFLGDVADEPLAPAVSWSSVTSEMQFKAAARCAWFADDQPVLVPGFRTPPKRLVRGRRHSAHTYYGIPLDRLLVVGLKDLATAVGRAGGVHAIDHLASTIHEGLFGSKISLDHQVRPATVYAEVYLRTQGHGGESNRFNPRNWFETARDEALYGRLWSLFVIPANKASKESVRYQIRSAVGVLRQVVAPFWRGQMPTDAAEAQRVVAQLTCGLTPISMDPVFGALLERALVQRGLPKMFRSVPAHKSSMAGGLHVEADAQKSLLNPAFRSAYARFLGLDDRPNFKEEVRPAEPLVRKVFASLAARRAANSALKQSS